MNDKNNDTTENFVVIKAIIKPIIDNNNNDNDSDNNNL